MILVAMHLHRCALFFFIHCVLEHTRELCFSHSDPEQNLYILVLCFISHEGHMLLSVNGWKWVYKYHLGKF